MPYVLDAIILVIVALTAIIGYRRGFVRTVIQLVRYVAAFLLAIFLSGVLSTMFYETCLREPLHAKIAQKWDETVVQDASVTLSQQAEALMDALPRPVQVLLDGETVTQSIRDIVADQQNSTAVANYFTDELLAPVLVTALRLVMFLLLFIILSFFMRLLEKLIRPITNLPLIRQANNWLGAAIGLVKGAVFAVIAVSVMQLIAACYPIGPFTQTNLDQSILVRYLLEINPLSAVIK